MIWGGSRGSGGGPEDVGGPHDLGGPREHLLGHELLGLAADEAHVVIDLHLEGGTGGLQGRPPHFGGCLLQFGGAPFNLGGVLLSLGLTSYFS